MSDDFDFDASEFEDAGPSYDPTPADPQPAPSPEPVVTIDPSEHAHLKNQVEALTRWKEDAAKVFTGQTQHQGMTKEDKLQQFVSDMDGYERNFEDRILSRVNEQQHAVQLEQKYLQQYPQYAPFKKEIFSIANDKWMEATSRGVRIDEDTAIQHAIKDFETRLQGFTQSQGNGQRLQHLALQPGAGASSMNPPSGQQVNFHTMPREEFQKYRQSRGTFNSDIYE